MSSEIHEPRLAVGKVYLVGAGPGDPGLITLRGVECLQLADVILYDGLVNPWILRHGHVRAQRTCRLDGPNGRTLPQEQINQQLVQAALEGLTVVRLKGGDPFVFGRGSEEAAVLAAHGIPFEVVPGVTAATAAAVTTGISLTHRDHASAVALVTGHEDPNRIESRLDYQALSQFPGTLVFYMGLHRLPQICEQLQRTGKPGHTPAAVVCRATTPRQRVVEGTLATIAGLARQHGLKAPSLVVIGDCVRVRQQAAWFEQRPLFGQKIAVLRAEEQAESAGDLIWRQGGEPVVLPCIRIERLDLTSQLQELQQRLTKFNWLLFTSVNGVLALCDAVWQQGGDARFFAGVKLAAIGPATGGALPRYGLRPDFIPSEFRGEALAIELPAESGDRVLWIRATRGREVIPELLAARQIECETLVAYVNVDVDAWTAEQVAELESGEVDWVVLSSPSIARRFASLATPAILRQLGTRLRIACFSPVTAAAANECQLPVSTVASEYTWAGVLAAIALQPRL